MKRNLLLNALAFLIFTAVCSMADEGGNQRLRELNRKIAELKNEKARILAKSATPGSPDPSGISDAQGRVDSRISNAVLLIEGDQSLGTGFIGSTGGKKYVYTTAAVLSGNSKLSIRNSAGTSFKKFGDLEAAEGADLVRMEILEEVKDFLEFQPAQPPVRINQKIAALGAGGGNGVVTVENGVVLGTSAETLEVDADNNKSNNGGPVVDISTGKVVGLATRISYGQDDIWSEGTRQGKSRRFACRLDREWTWKPMKIGKFLADGKALRDHLILTAVCYDLAGKLGKGCSYSMPAYVMTGRDAIDSFPDHELVKAYVEFMADLKGGNVRSPNAETKKRIRNLFVLMYSKAINSKDSLKSLDLAWCYRTRVEAYVQSRERCLKCLNSGLEEMK